LFFTFCFHGGYLIPKNSATSANRLMGGAEARGWQRPGSPASRSPDANNRQGISRKAADEIGRTARTATLWPRAPATIALGAALSAFGCLALLGIAPGTSY
jgi:hypothetical protein